MLGLSLLGSLVLLGDTANPPAHFPNWRGATGIMRTVSAVPNQPTTFGLKAQVGFFSTTPFIDNRKHSRSRLRLSGNYNFFQGLELFGGFSLVFNEHSDSDRARSSTSFFENSELGLRWSTTVKEDFWYFGAYGSGRAFSGTRVLRNTSGFPDEPEGPYVSGYLGLTSTWDWSKYLDFDLRNHINLGYRTPNSETNPSANAPLSERNGHIDLFNRDAYRYQALLFAAGAELPMNWFTPYLEYSMEYAIFTEDDPVDFEDNRQNVGMGTIITPHPTVGIHLGGEVGIGGEIGGKGVGIPENPPWEVFAGIAFQTVGDEFFGGNGKVQGQVVDSETGLALPDVQAKLVGEVRAPYVTDLAGYYEFENLSDGDYRIRFEKLGYQPSVESFSVERGDATVLDVVLSREGPGQGGLDALVRDAMTGEPIEGARVWVEEEEAEAFTDFEGTAHLSELTEGEQNLEINAPGYEPENFDVEIFANETYEQSFSLFEEAPPEGLCTGVVRNEEGTGLTAVISTEDQNVDRFATEPLDGSFSKHLEEGVYEFQVQAENYLPSEFTCEVVADEETYMEVVLEKPEEAVVVEDQIVLPEAIFFEFDSDRIQSKSFDVLDQVVDVLIEFDEHYDHLRVEGHTDNIGAADYNQDLSERRAVSVRQYLIEQGIDANRIVAQGFGEAEPVATNEVPEGRAENRRVEFNLVRDE